MSCMEVTSGGEIEAEVENEWPPSQVHRPSSVNECELCMWSRHSSSAAISTTSLLCWRDADVSQSWWPYSCQYWQSSSSLNLVSSVCSIITRCGGFSWIRRGPCEWFIIGDGRWWMVLMSSPSGWSVQLPHAAPPPIVTQSPVHSALESNSTMFVTQTDSNHIHRLHSTWHEVGGWKGGGECWRASVV